MLDDKWLLWLEIILIGAATLLPRASFIMAGSRVKLSPGIQRALRYAPVSALAALIVPAVITTGGTLTVWNPKLAAAAAVIVSVRLSRNPWLPFLAGMGVLVAFRMW